jgi:hypothetical protein
MKTDILLDAIGMINDDTIQDAKKTCRSARRKWIKWGAVAACFVLALTIIVPYISDVVGPKGGPEQNDLRPANSIEFNGAYYKTVDMEDIAVLEEYNLPNEITDDMIGDHLGTGLDADGNNYGEFYAYKPYESIVNEERVCRSVYIIKIDDTDTTFGLFCGFVSYDNNTCEDASEMFYAYGIGGIKDIASIQAEGYSEITDTTAIENFYNALINSPVYGNDDYQARVFEGKSKAEQQKFSDELTGNMIKIRVESIYGTVCYVNYYPTINYINWFHNYYELFSDIDTLIMP